MESCIAFTKFLIDTRTGPKQTAAMRSALAYALLLISLQPWVAVSGATTSISYAYSYTLAPFGSSFLQSDSSGGTATASCSSPDDCRSKCPNSTFLGDGNASVASVQQQVPQFPSFALFGYWAPSPSYFLLKFCPHGHQQPRKRLKKWRNRHMNPDVRKMEDQVLTILTQFAALRLRKRGQNVA